MRKSNTANGLTVNLIAGTYVVVIGIDIDQDLTKGLLGFAIKRTDHTESESYWLKGMRAFELTRGNAPEGSMFSTYDQPIQDFLWSDFTAKPNHSYTYEVVPVRGGPKHLTYDQGNAVDISTENLDSGTHAVYFNRGVLGSEAYAREFGASPDDLKGEAQAKAYAWLSRGLEQAMIDFIGQANSPRYALRAAVYEFDWPPISEALGTALKKCGDVQIVYDARVPGGKKGEDNLKRVNKAKAQFRKYGLSGDTSSGKSVVIPREQNPSYIAHNKFIVLLDKGNPVQVWTGSTNFTESGIFGQSNVGHLVRDPTIATSFHEYWKRVAADPEAGALRAANEQATPTLTNFPPPTGITPLFSPRENIDQLQWYANELNEAGIIDCFTAAFGVNEVFLDVFHQRQSYLRYIFLEKWGIKKADAAKTQKALSVDPFVQVAIGADLPHDVLSGWLDEITNTLSVHVRYTHNKFALIDPLGPDPVVITGSANFSDASTTNNDENMLVIRGDTRVADIYFGEYMRLWRHHKFRDTVQKLNAKSGKREPYYLVADDSWTRRFFETGTVKQKQRETFRGTGIPAN